MPPRKDIEKEIAKINKEIDQIKWQLKNEVLTPRQRDSKLEKLRCFEDNKKGPYKTGGRVEGATCELTEAIGRYGVQVTPTAPGGNMGKRFQRTA